MSDHDIQTNLAAFKHLHVVGVAVGIVPNFHITRIHQYKKCVIYPIIVICCLAILASVMIYGKQVTVGKDFTTTVYFLDKANDVFKAITNIFCVVSVSLMHADKVTKFYKTLQVIDCEFKSVNNLRYMKQCHFYWELCVFCVTYAFYVLFDAFVFTSNFGFRVYIYYALMQLQNFHLATLGMLLRHYAMLIKYRLQTLNYIVHNQLVRDDDVIIKEKDRNTIWTVKKARNVFTELTACVEQYNAIFGIHFVTLYICVLIGILVAVNVAIVYGTTEHTFAGHTFGPEIWALCTMNVSFPLLTGFALFSAGEEVTNEIKKVGITCYEILRNTDNCRCTEELEKFAQQVTNCGSRISAAGFFDVNHTAMFTLVGSISAYLIVILQCINL